MIVLFFLQEIWDLEIGVAFSDEYDWVELTPEMKEAALAIGFNEELWCDGGCDVLTADLTEVFSLAPSATVSVRAGRAPLPLSSPVQLPQCFRFTLVTAHFYMSMLALPAERGPRSEDRG